MLWACRQLLVPMNYLRIRHGESLFRSKAVYDYVLPLIFTVFTCSIFVWLDIRLAIFDHQEFAKRLIDLLVLMIVFFMAALAAVATFDRKGIDQPLRGGDACLKVRNPKGGNYVDKRLSYRQFISYIFGYLSFLSLCLYIVIVVLSVAWPKFEQYFAIWPATYYIIQNIVDPILFFAVIFAVWQLMFTALLGIYFLTERIQTLNE